MSNTLRILKISSGALAALVLLPGCGGGAASSTPTPATFSVLGTLKISQAMPKGVDGEPCFTSGGYGDIKTGAQVRVTNASGEVVALSELLGGVAEDNYPQLPGADVCSFVFVVGNIPGEDGDIFGVEVANRGSVSFKADGEMTSVSLTLN